MNEPSAGVTITKEGQAQANRLLTAFLARCPSNSMPSLRLICSVGASRSLYAELLALIESVYDEAYEDGYDDGFAEGGAAEPERNEGYE